jgi:histidine triad (HIT) family protein
VSPPGVRGGPGTSCRFCAIEAGTVPAHVVLENDVLLAFLDHRPVFPGHTLLIPRRHIETLPELPDDLLRPFFADARRIAAAMEGGFGAHGTFVALNNRISQSVPHLHVHVVPRHRKDGLRGFFWPRTRYADDAEAAAVAARVRAAIEAVE